MTNSTSLADSLAQSLALIVSTAFIGGLFLMALFAALHGAFHTVPTVGYWSAAGIMLFARGVVSALTFKAGE